MMPVCFRGLLPILVSFALLASATAAAPTSTGALFGRVQDAKTGRAVPGCKVRIIPADTVVVTDSLGRFDLSGLAVGNYRAVFIRSGYETVENTNIQVGSGMAEELLARLPPASQDSALELADLRARARKESRSLGNDPAGTIRFGRNDVLRAPGALQDVSMFAQSMPGVSRADDQTTDLVVRGGGPDENAFLIDGIPVFNINHFENNNRSGGGIGNINTYFLDDVEFHTGAFSARYPDRLSSVMDISFKRGNPSHASGMATADIAGVGGLLEGPIPGSGGNGTYGATMRMSALTLLDKLGIIEWGAVPRYGNGHLKVNYLAGKWDMTFNVLGGADGYDSRLPEGGLTGLAPQDSARYRVDRIEKLYTDNVFAGFRGTRSLDAGRVSLYAAGNTRRYDYEEGNDFALAQGGPVAWNRVSTRRGEESGGARVLWGADYDRYLGPRWTLRFGALHEYDSPEKTVTGGFRASRSGAADSSSASSVTRSSSYYTLGGYSEAAWKSGPWDLAGGLRVHYDEYTERALAGPRASVRRRLGDHTLKAAFGVHTQSQAATRFGNALPPGTGELPYNLQSVLGWDANLPLGIFTRVEAFDKQTFRLLRFRTDGGPRDTGRTSSRGFDLYLRKSLRSKAWGSASYTFSWNQEDRGGEWVNNAYSVPHSFTGALGYDLGPRFSASVRLGLGSGSPYTPVDTVTAPASIDPRLRFSRFTDSYFRLDTRVEYRHGFRAATLGIFMEISNLTDNENLFTSGEYYFEQGWGFLPIGGLTLSF